MAGEPVTLPREVLQRRLALLKKRNAAYSLRSFARHLEVSVAWLSAFLSGRKGMSSERAEAIALTLRLHGAERRGFLAATKATYARGRQQREQGNIDLREAPLPMRYGGIPREMWTVIASWRSYALVEILKRELESRDAGAYVALDLPRLAGVLGIELPELRGIVRGLLRAGLV